VTMSVHHSLVDAPSLLLIAWAMAWLERGRRGPGAAVLALAGLGRETSLLAVVGWAGADLSTDSTGSRPAGSGRGWRAPRTWLRLAGTAALVALPLLLWMGYVRWKVGPTDDKGLGNFTVPLGGFAEKWGESFAEIIGHPFSPTAVTTFATVLAVTAQFLFFALRWRPAEAWWRVGAAYAVMAAFLATPVWEGYPGAATRVLLPMMLAFNITVPRGWRWLPLLLAGNLTVLATYKEFAPPHEFFQLRGEPAALQALHIERTDGWYGIEFAATTEWRWSRGESGLQIHNAADRPLTLLVHGHAASARDERRVRIFAGGALVWSEVISTAPEEIRFGCTVPPGDTLLAFTTDVPGRPVGTDERLLAFRVSNLEIVVKPAPGKGS